METLGIYTSVPFCRSKCSYCNFASGVFPAAYHERYVDRLIAEIRNSRKHASGFGARLPDLVDSVYFGGGTPSILSPFLIQRLFMALRAEFQAINGAEITLECAPGQIEEGVLATMAECGVNRVSFGVQSFIDREAALTGRLHTRKVALNDIQRVKKAGIRSINVDLIAGLPHQTTESWRESLDVLVSSGVNHASVYMFEIDEDSRLGRELLIGGGRYHSGAVPNDDLVADFYLEAIKTLNRNGLTQYEISNFAHPGAESLHNIKYWTRQPYLGFGLDAHSMLRLSDGEAVRFQNGDDLQPYLDGAGLSEIQPISRRQALEEAWFLGLRMNEGVSSEDLKREFGEIDAHSADKIISELCSDGLMNTGEDRIHLTERGRLVSNEVFARFLENVPAEKFATITID